MDRHASLNVKLMPEVSPCKTADRLKPAGEANVEENGVACTIIITSTSVIMDATIPALE